MTAPIGARVGGGRPLGRDSDPGSDGRSDRGAAAVLVALAALPILIGSAVLGVDLARLQLSGQQAQRAADSAALAGVVFLPADPSRADGDARAAARANGIPPADVDVARVPGYPSRLSVRVSVPVKHGFGQLLGVPTHTVSRLAIADFARPLVLGSPCNVIGNEDMPGTGGGPEQMAVSGAGCRGGGRLWTAIQGPDSNKEHGDAVTARRCVWGPADNTPDGCSQNGFGPSPPGLNLDYRPGGYTYVIRVTRPGILRLQGYDLGWVATGSSCTGVFNRAGGLVSALAGADRVLTNEYVDSAGAASNARYAQGPGPFCAGDSQGVYPYDDDSKAALAMTTTVTPRRPGVSSWEPSTGAPLCPVTSYQGFDGLTTTLATRLRPGVGGVAGLALRRTFHRWAEICPATAVTPGDYTVTVTTGAGAGQNRYALRGWLEGQTGGVAVMAQERLGAYINIASGTSRFHLVRLDSSAAGRTLEVGIFDLGDAAGQIRLTLLGPDSDVPFGRCDVSGALVAAAAPCSILTSRPVSDSHWLRFRIPIPRDYRCSFDDDQSKCWVRAQIWSSREQYDATTWTAKMDGDPVRLVR